MTIRSRSEPAVISRLPSRPKARIAARPSGKRPCCRSNSRQRALEERAHDRLGEIGERLPGIGGVERAVQQPDGDQEAPLGHEEPRPVEHVLVAPRLRQAALAAPPRSSSRVRPPRERRRVEQRVGDMRPAREDLGEPRRGAQDRGEQVEQVGIVAEQREELRAGRQRLQQAVEGAHRRVRIAGAREALQQRRRDLGQALARGGRAHRREAPEMPAAHRLRHVLRIARSRAAAASPASPDRPRRR